MSGKPIFLRRLHLTPTPEPQAWPGTWKSIFLAKTKTFVFWHIAEISARYRRQIDRTDVAHLFCFQEIMKNWPRGPKKEAHDSKKKNPRGPKKRPMTLEKSGGHFSEKNKRLRQRRGSSRPSRNMGVIFLEKIGLGVPKSSPWLKKMTICWALAAIHPWWGYWFYFVVFLDPKFLHFQVPRFPKSGLGLGPGFGFGWRYIHCTCKYP